MLKRFRLLAGGCSNNGTGIQDLKSDKTYKASAKKLFTFNTKDPQYNVMQGGYYDGNYFYVAMVKKDEYGFELTKIHVLDKKGKIIKVSDPLDLDHANNITYNPKKRMLLISLCQAVDGHNNRYSFVDPKTFEIKETADLINPFFSMAYSKGKDMYASGQWAGQTLDIWDGELNHIKSVSVEYPGSLSQGVFCDDEYIYFVRSSQNGYQAEIRIYDFDCNLIWAIPLEVPDGVEPENINIVKGKTYIMGNDWKNSCSVVYVLDFEEV